MGNNFYIIRVSLIHDADGLFKAIHVLYHDLWMLILFPVHFSFNSKKSSFLAFTKKRIIYLKRTMHVIYDLRCDNAT